MKIKSIIAATVLALCAGTAVAETYRVGEVTYRNPTSNIVSFGLIAGDKLLIDSVDDPKVSGVTCWWSRAQTGGVKGAVGLAEDPSDVSLACRQVGPIKFKEKFAARENVAKESRNWTSFKTMQVVRFCDERTNTLVYLVFSDHVLEGSPKNAISAVPMQPWGNDVPPLCKTNVR